MKPFQRMQAASAALHSAQNKIGEIRDLLILACYGVNEEANASAALAAILDASGDLARIALAMAPSRVVATCEDCGGIEFTTTQQLREHVASVHRSGAV